MTKFIIGVAGALVLAAGAARADDKKSSQSPQGSTAPGTSAPATSGTKAVSGDVQAVDVPAMAITIIGPAGEVQHLIIATDAPITRDGTAVSLDQVKQGDNVRASYDPSTQKASKIEVKSKDKAKASAPSK
ncbi:MAG TPA: hypothetical protein VN883_06365 [Myxococcales bacterium]|jgi:hypothetical protein|nr:hypothetical protein [Myxococcales bacterium]